MATELRSPSGRVAAVAQDDGNFVLYPRRADGSVDQAHPLWNEWDDLGRSGTPPDSGGPTRPPAPAPLPDPTPLPAERRILPITDALDGQILNSGQSYWPQAWINPRIGAVFVLVGHQDGYPRFFKVTRSSGRVERLGPLLRFRGTGEGWFWDREGRITLCQGARLLRVDPLHLGVPGQEAVLIDISSSHPGCDLWQPHSSADGSVHTATIRRVVAEGRYPYLGTIIQGRDRQDVLPVEREPLDESDIDASGRWVLIKEGPGPDNKLVDRQTGQVTWIADHDRAMGHSAMGSGVVVGEADKPDPGQCGIWDLASRTYRGLYNTWNMGHVSVQAGRCVISDGEGVSLLDLGSGQRTHLADAAMPDDAGLQASLDPTGSVVVYVAIREGRPTAFLLDLGARPTVVSDPDDFYLHTPYP